VGRKLLKPDIGDVFRLPLPDGSFALGHVTGLLPKVYAVGCVLYDVRGREPLFEPDLVAVSAQLVTPDQLERRNWPIIGSFPVPANASVQPWHADRDSLVGLKILGSGVFATLAAAFHGLAPWDGMHDPAFFDNLLLAGVRGPGKPNAHDV
jgi:hypothetical protein